MMKMIPVIVLVGFIGLATTGLSGEDENVIALFSSCDIQPENAETVASQIERYTGAPVRIVPCLKSDEFDLKAFAQQVQKGLAPGDRVSLALFSMGTNETDHTVLTVKNGPQPFAMIDVRTLLRDNPKGELRDKTISRRMQKESLRALSLLLRGEQCPTLFCASSRHRSIKHLDEKSYNYCPPCREKLGDALRKRGITVKTPFEQLTEDAKKLPGS
jgi:hypothetical protein